MNNTFAAIDLGSNYIKLKIVQYVSKNIYALENITKPINIGEGVYHLGYIEHERVKEITAILSSFKRIMDGYEVYNYKAVATSAFRIAQNGRNVIEVILMKTGIKIDIVEDTIEKHLTYKSIRDNMKDFKSVRNSALLVELNTNSSDVSLYRQNKLELNEEFILGTVVLKTIIKDLENRSSHYPEIAKELIVSRTNHIWHHIKYKKIKHFIAIGGEAKLMKQHIFNNQSSVSREAFYSIYDQVIYNHRAYRKTIEGFSMDWYEFIASILVYETFFSLVSTQTLLLPDINLRDGLICQLLEETYGLSRYQMFENDSISLGRTISKRNRSALAHCYNIEKNALQIFGALKDHFFFEKKDLKLLRLSAILHEIGKFTRVKDYLATSFEKIRNLSILGMSQNDMLLIAYICRYMNAIDLTTEALGDLSEKEHNLVCKLSSILSLADALDKSKTQKITILGVDIEEEEMFVHVNAKADITLESWEFDSNKRKFINTFGIAPIIVEKSDVF